MAITAGITTAQRQRWIETLSEDTLMIALYTNAANLDPTTLTAYTTAGESSGTGYTAGGQQLQNVSVVVDNNAGVLDFDDVTWDGITVTARGALVYNASEGNRAIAILDFGSDRVATGGSFVIVIPSPTDTTGIVRVVMEP